MHGSRSPIDIDLQNTFFKTIRDERVFQKILYVENDSSYDETMKDLISSYPGGGYQHNYHGHILEHDNVIQNQREIIMQSLGTIIMTLKLMSDDFDHWDPNSALRKAYQEAVDKNLFSYTPERPEFEYMSEEQTIYKFLGEFHMNFNKSGSTQTVWERVKTRIDLSGIELVKPKKVGI